MGRKKGVADFDESPPDDFDPANPYKDPVAMLEMREHIVREKWIQIEKAKILRDKLRWCYRASKASITSRSAANSATSPKQEVEAEAAELD
ncbi:hypothetical protein M0R45_023523 [Rubus argutus]|uniref:Uncharacterized protein n=1 Tax=Rubus argutus TaxID=59490 RepID=A0AAW1WSH1_RUBAR